MSRIENLEWLTTFVAVADHGTFSRAARAVHRSQSRVSAHIAALEAALGRPLFDRRHRPVELTDAGEAFLPYARDVLARLEEGTARVDALTGVLRGSIVVGAHPSISAGFLPEVLRDFCQRHPQVSVEITEGTTAGMADALLSGRVHLALRSTTAGVPPPGLHWRPLWTEPYVAVLPADHPLAALDHLGPHDLVDDPFIAIGQPGADIDPDTRAVFDRWGVAPEVSWRTEQPQTLANLVKAGMGIGLSNALAMRTAETTGLSIVPVGPIDQGRTVGLWVDPARYASAATRALHRTILTAPRPSGTAPPPSPSATDG